MLKNWAILRINDWKFRRRMQVHGEYRKVQRAIATAEHEVQRARARGSRGSYFFFCRVHTALMREAGRKSRELA